MHTGGSTWSASDPGSQTSTDTTVYSPLLTLSLPQTQKHAVSSTRCSQTHQHCHTQAVPCRETSANPQHIASLHSTAAATTTSTTALCGCIAGTQHRTACSLVHIAKHTQTATQGDPASPEKHRVRWVQRRRVPAPTPWTCALAHTVTQCLLGTETCLNVQLHAVFPCAHRITVPWTHTRVSPSSRLYPSPPVHHKSTGAPTHPDVS